MAAETDIREGAATRPGPARPRLRVLTLIENPSAAGGAERMAAETAITLDPARFDRILCATRRPVSPQLDSKLVESGVRVMRLQRRSRADVAAWLPLVQLLRRERIDVIHAHLFGSNLWASLLSLLTPGTAVVAHVHGQAYSSKLRAGAMRRLVASRVDVVLCVSRHERERIIERQGIPSGKLRVLSNGIPSSGLPAASGADVRDRLGIATDAPVVSIVANLRPEKAVDHAVRAFAAARDALPTARMLVIGDGPERGRVEAAVEELGLRGSVSLLGRRADVPDLLAATDVAVLSSRREGCPVALLEYMAAGRAIVAPRVGGVPDVIADGVHGLLVPSADPAVMGAAMTALLRDPDQRRRLGDAARHRQQKDFTLAAMNARLQDLYECLAAARGR